MILIPETHQDLDESQGFKRTYILPMINKDSHLDNKN